MAQITIREIEDLAFRALTASNTSAPNARSVAVSIASAEASGIPSHGMLRLPVYCAHARSGKVDGHAQPSCALAAPAVIRVDARNGFAHPAIDLAIGELTKLARMHGVATAAVHDSYNSGVMGDHVERLAREGLVAMAFANAPAVIAPWGGKKPVFGTNPFAFAAPRGGGDPVVVDQASSVVARGEVMLHAQRGEAIPQGWGLDAQGLPTTSAEAVLNGGSMMPAAGHKGTSLALVVELLAATLTGSLHSFEAGSLTHDDGRKAGIGQLLIALDPRQIGGPAFEERAAMLCDEIAHQPGARLPGTRRFLARIRAQELGVTVDPSLMRRINAIAGISG